ncbi:putative MFS family arabinose efflux permease [Paucimonas lemoignei]|uniref:Putative MFS family arabinose efflux permease n=2 Tax=Paucimonas lemoignei TaxID=29443 RepID=A0A4R3HVZ0_PAULE|nr:putative MFS family arabinose efflux permease [Paucimonas lemoignei]
MEIRASASLAGIFALRMLGLFLLLPIFAEHAKTMPGGDNLAMVGLAMGIYGLAQAFCQIPFGIFSDRYGRKPVIIAGLIMFAIGAVIAALANNVLWIVVGRALQGAGAISAAVMALISDATREQHRTKAMAMVGGSIGITFALSMVGAPLLYKAIGMSGIFWMTAFLALVSIAVVRYLVPDVPAVVARRVALRDVLKNRELLRLNFGVFVLHLTQVAIFIVVPSALVHAMDLPVTAHWKVYLPVVLASFILMLPPIFVGEKLGKIKQIFVAAIMLLLAVQLGLWWWLAQANSPTWLLIGLLLAFFIAFNILEASQPSLVSRIAPPAAKGTALGVYNTLQSLGVFCGGALGGWLVQHAGRSAVFQAGAGMTVLWLIMAVSMKNLPRRSQAAVAA